MNCSACGLLLLESGMCQNGCAQQGIGIDPLDGQIGIPIGDGMAIEPGTGQIDFDEGGIDIPLF